MSQEVATSASAGRILIVDDEPEMASGLKLFLKRLKYDVQTVGLAELALEKLKEEPVDLVLTDLMLPGISGLELLERVKAAWPDTFVVLFTGFATVENAVQAIRKGAFDYISKPFTPQQLEVVVNRAFQHKRLADENRSLRGQIRDRFAFESLVGLSEPMKKVHGLLSRVAATDASVLIYGESGTGKELIARAVHANSRRQDKPFVPLDCAALPQNLLESELFGYEKGAFTGAVTSRAGLLEAAHGGTFFMDELGELDLSMQVKLLRVLQERQFRRVGGAKIISVDVRIVAATNPDLEKEVNAGLFREDLYHRLNVIQVRLPALRERWGDIPLLAQHFLNLYVVQIGKPGLSFSGDALQALETYHWPGNVRELQNAIEYAVSISEGPRIDVHDLPHSVQSTYRQRPVTSPPPPEPVAAVPVPVVTPDPGVAEDEEVHSVELKAGMVVAQVHHDLPYKRAKRKWLESFEREYFIALLKRHGYNISHAARAAQIDRKSIQRILKKNELDIDRIVEEE